MKNKIDEVAKLLMYSGPSLNELIAEAQAENKKIEMSNHNKCTLVEITFETAYTTKVTDIYTFNNEQELIKQELKINGKVKVVFDKYEEAKSLLKQLSKEELVAS